MWSLEKRGKGKQAESMCAKCDQVFSSDKRSWQETRGFTDDLCIVKEFFNDFWGISTNILSCLEVGY
jgi:hypothetical protein